jgi:hypothetical protein
MVRLIESIISDLLDHCQSQRVRLEGPGFRADDSFRVIRYAQGL